MNLGEADFAVPPGIKVNNLKLAINGKSFFVFEFMTIFIEDQELKYFEEQKVFFIVLAKF